MRLLHAWSSSAALLKNFIWAAYVHQQLYPAQTALIFREYTGQAANALPVWVRGDSHAANQV